jgi:hypothetical protein
MLFKTHFLNADSITQYHQLSFIALAIHQRTEADEHGEPPDTDELLEALQLPDSYSHIVDLAYDMYYSRGGKKYYENQRIQRT